MTSISIDSKKEYSFVPVHVSENLDPATVMIKDVTLHHEEKKLKMTVPIKNNHGKNYYVTTECLDPGSIIGKSTLRRNHNEKEYVHNTFVLNKKPNTHVENGENPSENPNENPNGNLIKITDTNHSHMLFDKLNTFKRSITNRIKYMMKIPEYLDNAPISLAVKTIKLADSILLSNIIEYNGMRNNFSFGHLKQVFRLCKCRLLIRIDGLDITNKNVYLKIVLIRVYPENIDVLDSSTKVALLECLNTESMKNMRRYCDLNQVSYERRYGKHRVKNELVNLLVKKPSKKYTKKF